MKSDMMWNTIISQSCLWSADSRKLQNWHIQYVGDSMAKSTFSPVSSLSSDGINVCVCVCMEWTWSVHYIGISTYQFILYYASVYTHMHACIWVQTHARICTHFHIIWGQQTNGAKSGHCWFNHKFLVHLILMHTNSNISAIRWQDPILGIASVDKGGGALDVLGAAKDLCLKAF